MMDDNMWKLSPPPEDGFYLAFEDGAVRTMMFELGRWEPVEIPVLVDRAGNEMVPREVAELRGERLKISGSLYEPTHWMDLPDGPSSDTPTG